MSPKLAQRLDPFCDRFEAAWLAGQRPVIEELLPQIAEADRHALLVELLALEVEYRSKHGERPTTEEYLRRFPEFTTVVHHAFERSRTGTKTQNVPDTSGQVTADFSESTSVRPADQPSHAGRCQLQHELARGGMGVVWRARDPELGRPLAVKLLLEQHANRLDMKRRFREEAQLTSQLQHPGIPPVHEVGVLSDGRPYFTMKLIEGRTLAELLQLRITPADNLPRFVSIFEQVCQTMAYAHSKRVIHRDLKPSNVMVGAFGEVQVMDWGLSKRLDSGSPGQAIQQEESDSSDTAALDAPGTMSTPGTVLGTPAFMAPEQARGEVEQLDQRCDVFGLGGILCVILTGQPPYQGSGRSEIHSQAAQGNLSNAFARLDSCGADGALIELTKQCLAAEKQSRLADAEAVATAVSQYQEALRQRLAQAEVDVTEARTRAAEEQKRLVVERQKRRLTVALAGAFILLLMIGAVAALWYQRDRAERKRRHDLREQAIRDSLDKANTIADGLKAQLGKSGGVFQLLNNPSEWKQQIVVAQVALQRAVEYEAEADWPLSEGLRRDLRAAQKQLEADDADRALAQHLDQIRQRGSVIVEDKVDYPGMAAAYAECFRREQFDILKESPAHLAGRLRQSSIKEQLQAALADWALCARVAGDGGRMRQLLAVVRELDTNPWSQRLWQDKVWEDTSSRLKLVYDMRRELGSLNVAEKLSPQSLYLFGFLLEGTNEADGWLRQAQAIYPDDFWLNFQLGAALYPLRPDEGIAHYRIALALRPQSSAVHYRVGKHMQVIRYHDAAVRHFKKVLQLDSENSQAHHNLALTLLAKRLPDEAITHFRRAIALNANHFEAHFQLSRTLRAKQDIVGAQDHLVRALKLKSFDYLALLDMGDYLTSQKDYPGAIQHYRKSLSVHSDPEGLSKLGAALLAHGQVAQAKQSLQQALKLLPPASPLRENVQNLLKQCEQPMR